METEFIFIHRRWTDMNAVNDNSTRKNSIRVSANANPFAVQLTDAIPFDFRETPFDGIESFYEHVRRFNFRGCIRGHHGRGKTTLLRNLKTFLCNQRLDCEMILIPRERSIQHEKLKQLIQIGQSGSIILIDGIERIPFLARHRLVSRSRSFGGFIATTHWPGRLPTLVRCRSSQQLLASILVSLDVDQPNVTSAAIPLLVQNRGNVRIVLRELYDQLAEGNIQLRNDR